MNDNKDKDMDIEMHFEKPKLERQIATSFELSTPKINVPEPPKGTKHFWNNFESPIKQDNKFKINLVSDSQISNWYNSLNFYEKKKWLQYFISNLSENDISPKIIDNEIKLDNSELSFDKVKSNSKINELN